MKLTSSGQVLERLCSRALPFSMTLGGIITSVMPFGTASIQPGWLSESSGCRISKFFSISGLTLESCGGRKLSELQLASMRF